MFEWIKICLANYARFVRMADMIDDRVRSLASPMLNMETIKQAEIICGLIERKNRVINLRVIADRIKKGLGEDWDILCDRFVEGDDVTMIAQRLGIGRTAVCYRINRAMKKAEKILRAAGLDESFFNNRFNEDRCWLFGGYGA